MAEFEANIVRPVPECAICNRPVDALVMYYDQAKRQCIYEARCHGDTERSVASDEDFEFHERVQMAKAFARKALT